jgi:hypothetical protein
MMQWFKQCMNNICENTDKEIWRRVKNDYYSPSIHVTENGGIGINCRGHVIVAPLENWFTAGRLCFPLEPKHASLKWKLAMWLLKCNVHKISKM